MLTERLAIVLETIGSSAVVKDFGKVSGAAQGLGAATTKTGGLLKGLGPMGAQAGAGLTGAITGAASIAGAALVSFGVKGVEAFTTLGQEVLKFQRASGATAEQASALIAAFDDVGIAAETGSKGIFQLGKRIGETGEGLKEYGVVAARDAGGNIDLAQTLKVVADAYVNTQDPARRAQLVTAAFGKSGQELIPILERGSAGIDALYESAAQTGQILSQEEVNKAESFRLAMDNLNDSMNKLTLAVGSGLVPKLTQLATVASQTIDKFDALGDNKFFKKVLDFVPLAISPLAVGLNVAGHALDLVDTSASDAAGGLGEFGTASGLAIGNAAELDATLQGLEQSLLGVSNAERAVAQAQSAVTSAEQRVTSARERYNEVLREGVVDEKKVESATRALTSATRDHERALEAVEDAQERVNTLTEELLGLTSGKTGAEKVKEAENDLTGARLRQRSAVQRVSAAQNRLNTLELSGTATAYELEEARIELGEADLDLRRANDDVTTSETALHDAQMIGAENSPEVIRVRGELDDATADLNDRTEDLDVSTQNLTAATEGLKAAEAGDPVKYSQDLATARGDLKTAEEGLATARQTLGQRTYDLITAQDILNGKLVTGNTEAGLLKGKFEEMLAKHPELASFLNPLIDDLDAAIKLLSTPVVLSTGGAGATGTIVPLLNVPVPVHAAGGIATRPSLGVFGEAGPEALIPLDRLGEFTGGGGGATYYINVSALDPLAASDAVMSAIREYERRSGTSWRN